MILPTWKETSFELFKLAGVYFIKCMEVMVQNKRDKIINSATDFNRQLATYNTNQ